jgi:hypothetical protein
MEFDLQSLFGLLCTTVPYSLAETQRMIKMRRQASPTPMTFIFLTWILFNSGFQKAKSLDELDKGGYRQVPHMTFVFSSWKSREEFDNCGYRQVPQMTFVFDS